MRTKSLALKLAAFALIASLAGAQTASAATQLVGAGSTFDYPFFSKAFYQYTADHPDVTVNYQSIGSGGGIEQFTKKTVDFGATDVPLAPDELKRAEAAGGSVVQIPVALGGVVISYNLPDSVKGPVRLTRELVADIYLGTITNWNDSHLKRLNPNANLPNLPIVVVHRSDGSGTTYIFTDFLSHVSSAWKTKVGTGKSVDWPASSSVGGKGNEGVAGAVRQTPGAIGYVELAYALENKMPQAALQNKTGPFVSCSQATVAAAASSKPNVSATDFSIVDAAGAKAWPISGYSWVIMWQNPTDKARGKLLRDVMNWLVTKGQQIAGTLDYVPLPSTVGATATKSIALVKV